MITQSMLGRLSKTQDTDKGYLAPINDRFVYIGFAVNDKEEPVFSTSDMSDVIWLGLAQSFADTNQVNIQPVKEMGTFRTYLVSDGTVNSNYQLTGVMLGYDNYLAQIYGKIKVSNKLPAYLKPGFKGKTARFYANLQSFIFRKSFCLIIGMANPEISMPNAGFYQFSTFYAIEGATINSYNLSVQTNSLMIYENLVGSYSYKRILEVETPAE